MDYHPGGSSRKLKRLFWLLLIANIAFIFFSRYYLQPLTTAEIVKFEVAKYLPVAQQIVRDWQAEDKIDLVKEGIYLDYFFIILYTAGLMVWVLYFSRNSGSQVLSRSGKFLACLMPVAAICDVIENIFMSRGLNGHLTPTNVWFTYDMAVGKFSIIILVLILILVCGIFWIGRLFKPKEFKWT